MNDKRKTNPMQCPSCGSKEISQNDHIVTVKEIIEDCEGKLRLDMICEHCDEEWMDTYILKPSSRKIFINDDDGDEKEVIVKLDQNEY